MDRTELFARMGDGRPYPCGDERLVAEQLPYLDKTFAYNRLPPSHQAEKQAMLKEMFAEIGEGCYIETPFHANWAGRFVHFGDRVYANYNLMLVDDGEIFVGDDVMMGPNVMLCTATHPVHADLRRSQVQYNLPIHIGKGVWIGGGSIVLPGITIGENSVIGAGSVVTHDVPANVVAVGSPCRVLRGITEEDRLYYRRGMKMDYNPEEA